MFIDRAHIHIKAGSGGNGRSSFRREKYVPEGGPDGGDGGKGGDVYFVVDRHMRTLLEFRYKKHFKADSGGHGQGKNMFGASGDDLEICVPTGTVLRDADTGEIVADLTTPGHRFLAAKGGRGGRGNARFATSTRRAPIYAEKGEPGEEHSVDLELKLLADVGLVGFPNAGKSTIISRVSACKPKIADYPFTTLEPNLGVVDLGDGNQFVIADIPGLIEGAHSGHGLGHQFLRHIERTRVLMYVVDIAGTEGRDPIEDFRLVCSELSLYNTDLARRPGVVAANKLDVLNMDSDNIKRLSDAAAEKGLVVFPISGVTGEGIDVMIKVVSDMLAAMADDALEVGLSTVDQTEWRINEDRPAAVVFTDGIYEVSGSQVERLAAMTDFQNEAALRRFQRVLRATGIISALKAAGACTGDGIKIGKLGFDFVDDEES